MKKIALILFLSVVSMAGNSQGKSGFGFFTDRDVYTSGESVLAKMYIPSGDLSVIAHLDLVNQSGKRISGVSIEIKDSQADGYFQLPDSLSSGTYLLRAYLRNSADKCRIIREIWVANRFVGLEKITGINRVINAEQLPVQVSDEIKMTGLPEEAKTNLGIQAQIQLDEKLMEKLDGNLLISVARIVPQFKSSTFQLTSANAQTGLTEGKGIIFSGTVTDKKTSTVAPNVTVYMTIPDSIPRFQYYTTGNDGRFYFLIDKYYGNIQAIIQCFPNDPAQRLKITRDEPFAALGAMPGFSAQPVPEEFKNDVTRCIEALTVQKIFGQETLLKQAPHQKKADAYPFYGIPASRIDPQQFIDLPNFAEISKELLPGVKFRNYNNEPTIQVLNSPAQMHFAEQPLVLLDGIPIRDLNVIKDLGTTDIDYIDICPNERFYGDLKFQGVIAIYSTKSDYLKLPETERFIKLETEAIQIPVQLTEPVIPGPSVPDLRQVLYWNASAQPAKTIDVKFGTSNVLGRFRLIVRGRTSDGTLIFAEKQFDVK
jgi:hypothetical protein